MRPQCTHITRKRSVFYYRRRLPLPATGEVSLSLRTRSFREAEHRAGWLDSKFREALERMTHATAIADILRIHLAESLERDRQQQIQTRSGRPVYALQRSGPFSDPIDDDLNVLECWRSLKTDHLCSLKIDQRRKPSAGALGVF